MFQSLFKCTLTWVSFFFAFRSFIQFSTKKKALHRINYSFHLEIVMIFMKAVMQNVQINYADQENVVLKTI